MGRMGHVRAEEGHVRAEGALDDAELAGRGGAAGAIARRLLKALQAIIYTDLVHALRPWPFGRGRRIANACGDHRRPLMF